MNYNCSTKLLVPKITSRYHHNVGACHTNEGTGKNMLYAV